MRIAGQVFQSTYRDSVFLMRVSSHLRRLAGVVHVELLMGTASNLETLRRAGLLPPEVSQVRPRATDLVVVAAGEPDAVDEALRQARAVIEGRMAVGPGGVVVPLGSRARHGPDRARSLEEAVVLLPDANLALISVPGVYVRQQALKALAQGLNLMIFSDNVPVEDEVAIKTEAQRRGLLVMGPDCGTAFLGGAALGFCNRVRRGPVGLVGAAGTGLQEVMCLVHRAGAGISHAIGVGTHDVQDVVGGQSTLAALDLLAADSATRVIALVSKPPGPATATRLVTRLADLHRPAVVCLLGLHLDVEEHAELVPAATLEEAAIRAAALADGRSTEAVQNAIGARQTPDLEAVGSAVTRLGPSQRFVRGLFVGGTLAIEAALVLRERVGDIWSNLPLAWVRPLGDPRGSREHTIVDLGDDVFTAGRPHPMLEPGLREDRLVAEAADPSVAVILLDVVLGYGVHPDPVGPMIPAIQRARERARSEGREVHIIASVCGTDQDPQGWTRQVNALRAAGVTVASSNAAAARLAGEIARAAAQRG